jgi:hypothetical protein
MTVLRAGRSFGAALWLGAALVPVASGAQSVLDVDTRDGVSLGRMPFGPAQEICLRWNHSVTGGAVADCFENKGGILTLTRSYLHDFAAGLGEVTGRGQLVSAPEGGYWITAINEPVAGNLLSLRVGPARVNHVLTGADISLPLSKVAPDTAVVLRLHHD